MGLHTCDIASVDEQALRPSKRCVDGATSHRDAAGWEMTCMRWSWMRPGLAFSPRTSFRVLHRWCEVLPHVEVCRTCLCEHSPWWSKWPQPWKSGLSVRQGAPAGAWLQLWSFRGMRRVFDCMFRSLAVLTAWMFASSGGKMCWWCYSSQGVLMTPPIMVTLWVSVLHIAWGASRPNGLGAFHAGL